MSYGEDKVPKIIHIRIFKGEGFKLSEYAIKKKKSSTNWRVICSVGNKKQATPLVPEDRGNPFFNCDMKVKIPKKQICQPVNLLVIDSFENQVGQVLLMPLKVLPSPPNVNLLSPDEAESVLFGPNNLIREELEQTKKNADPHGFLYFWCFVEEYRPEAMSMKQAEMLRSSHSNLSQSNTSLFSRSKQDLKDMFRRKHKLSIKRDSKMPDGMESSNNYDDHSRQLYGSGTFSDSMSNLSISQQPVRLSRNPSDCSVILHHDYREPADGRVDSEASSIATYHRPDFMMEPGNNTIIGGNSILTIPQLREIPPSPTSISNSLSNYSGTIQRSHTLGSANDLSRNQISQIDTLVKATSSPGEFYIFPEFGALNKEFSVKLIGVQVASWIRKNVISVRIHDVCQPVDECVEFSKNYSPHSDDSVNLRMPPQSHPLQCKVEMETTFHGMVTSLNQFSYTIEEKVINDARRSASFGRSNEAPTGLSHTKPPVAPSSSRSALRSIGGSLLNLAGLGNSSSTANTKSKLTSHQRNQSDSWSIMSHSIGSHQDSSHSFNRSNKDLSKDLNEINAALSKENANLTTRVGSVDRRINQLMDENVTLKSRLASREKEIEDLCERLCKLRLQLLNDGLTKYLEVT